MSLQPRELEDSQIDGPPDAPSSKRLRASNDLDGGSSRSGPRRKSACQSCRIRKIKCDATRPSCALCRAAGNDCEYIDELVKLTYVKIGSSFNLEPLGKCADCGRLEQSTQVICQRLDSLQRGLDHLSDSAQYASSK